MTTLNELKPAENRLWSVEVNERCFVSGIEAKNAREALDEAEHYFDGKHPRNAISMTSEPIYEASIGIETDERGVDEDADTSNGVFDIVIRGCDPKRVNEVKLALVKLIGGPGLDDDDYDEIGSTRALEHATEGMMVTSF